VGDRESDVRARPARRRETYAERRSRRAEVTDPAVVLEAAARYLEARPRSVAETRRHLVAAGYRGELVDGAVDRLSDLGILDDEAFARAWVESRDRAHPRAKRALQRELVLKGIDRVIIDGVLGERDEPERGLEDGSGTSPTADERAAERLLARKASWLARIDDPRQRRQRAYALLVRSGFDSGTAASVAQRAVETMDLADVEDVEDVEDVDRA
jgi:regulatory protein